MERNVKDRTIEKLSANETATQKVFSLMGMIGCSVLGLIIWGFLGYYAFGNPDPKSCWVVRDLAASALTKEGILKKASDMGVDVVDGYPVNMAKVYQAWFTWGFWNNTIVTITSITAWVVKKYNSEKAALVINGIFGSLFCISSVIWLMFGAIWRFSKAGTIASGDRLERLNDQTDDQWNKSLQDASKQFGYQVSGGRFMKIFLLIVGWAMILGSLMSIIMCMVMACCDPRERGERPKSEYGAGGNRYQQQEDYTVDQDGEEDEESEDERELRGEQQQYRMVGRNQ